jgi:hypothetical protein
LPTSVEWDGLSFPEQILDSAPAFTTYEKTLSFTRHGLSGPSSTPGKAVPPALVGLEHGWAAVVSAEICTSAAALLQHLELRATPGTELLVNGAVVARARAHDSSSAAFPRGPETATPFVRWVSRGCDNIQLRMYDPLPCPAGHAESLLVTPAPSETPLGELRIAYSNTSVILCISEDCSDAKQFRISAETQKLVVHVAWDNRTVHQGVGLVDTDGAMHDPVDWVRCTIPSAEP